MGNHAAFASPPHGLAPQSAFSAAQARIIFQAYLDCDGLDDHDEVVHEIERNLPPGDGPLGKMEALVHQLLASVAGKLSDDDAGQVLLELLGCGPVVNHLIKIIMDDAQNARATHERA